MEKTKSHNSRGWCFKGDVDEILLESDPLVQYYLKDDENTYVYFKRRVGKRTIKTMFAAEAKRMYGHFAKIVEDIVKLRKEYGYRPRSARECGKLSTSSRMERRRANNQTTE